MSPHMWESLIIILKAELDPRLQKTPSCVAFFFQNKADVSL